MLTSLQRNRWVWVHSRVLAPKTNWWGSSHRKGNPRSKFDWLLVRTSFHRPNCMTTSTAMVEDRLAWIPTRRERRRNISHPGYANQVWTRLFSDMIVPCVLERAGEREGWDEGEGPLPLVQDIRICKHVLLRKHRIPNNLWCSRAYGIRR